MTIREAIKEAHECAKEHGFHNPSPSIPTLLALIITELSEAIEAERINNRCKLNINDLVFNENLPLDRFKSKYGMKIKDTFESELAGACIRIFDLAGLLDLKICKPTTRLREPDIPGNIMEVMVLIAGAYLSINVTPEFIFQLSIALGTIFAIAKKFDINLWLHIEAAMKYNRLRKYKHGKKY